MLERLKREQPVALANAVKAIIMLLLALLGFVTLSEADIQGIGVAIGGLVTWGVIEVVTTLWTKRNVYSPKTVEETGAVAMIPKGKRVDRGPDPTLPMKGS